MAEAALQHPLIHRCLVLPCETCLVLSRFLLERLQKGTLMVSDTTCAGIAADAPYAVTARLDGRLWFIEIPAIDGATQAQNVGEIEEMAIDYIAAVTDAPETEVHVTIELILPEAIKGHLSRAVELRTLEAEARTGAAEQARLAARALRNAGLTLREVGTVLGVSHQRAQQLVSS